MIDNVIDAESLRRMFEMIDACPAPVVCLVQGLALGGGCGLVACADVADAEPSALFAFSEVKLGVAPAIISPYVLTKIGRSTARRYFVTGERFDAETALRIGLVHELADDLVAAEGRFVGELLTAAPEAARAVKRLVRGPLSIEETAHLMAERRASDEGQEGLRAQLNGRRPGRTGFASWCPPATDEESSEGSE